MTHTTRNYPNVRRGISSVLAMMFLAIVASLVSVMAIVAEGNVRSADAAIRMSRSLSAAESGLRVASWRLARESARFVVEAGDLEDGFGTRLWEGTWTVADGVVTVEDPDGYLVSSPSGTGLMYAIYDAHQSHDTHAAVYVDAVEVTGNLNVAGGIVESPGVTLYSGENPPWYQLRYEMLADGSGVRVTSRGVDDDVQRIVQMDFSLEKRIEYAVLGQSRIMVGKNVMVDGPVGALYGTIDGELDPEFGDPLVLRSDFYDLDAATLDPLLDTFSSLVGSYDVDGDGRLRPGHPTEGVGISGNPDMVDHDGDQFVDDFDLFLGEFDANADSMVAYDLGKAVSSGYVGLTDEFDVDNDLAALLDNANPDRNQDGVVDASDMGMGYDDGVLDVRDRYSKIRGALNFAVDSVAWDTARGAPWQTRARGVVRTNLLESPATFNMVEPELVSLTTDMFLTSQTWYETKAISGSSFASQIAAYPGAGSTTTGPEGVPYGSAGAYDLYDRPIYNGITFTNVLIPMGTNALFENCTFVGATWVETTEDCTDVNWNYAGALETGPSGPQLRYPDMTAVSGSTTYTDTRTVSNNLRFDGCTFLGTLGGDRPLEYTHWKNKVQLTGGTRFFVDPSSAVLSEQADAGTLQGLLSALPSADLEQLARSSMMLPGWSVDVGNFDSNTSTPITLTGTIVAGVIDIRGAAEVYGTVMTTFRPTEGEGPLYYGGTPDAFNTTFGYFGDEDGDWEGPDTSDPSFAGYGSVVLRYDPEARLPDGIPWPLQSAPQQATWYEGGAW